jgi:hypothetical protein
MSARETEAQMTDDERFGMIHSLMIIVFTTGKRDERVPADVPQLAGWVKGVPRLGVPNLLLTDAGLGITNPGGGRKGDTATAFPSAQLQGATFNPALSRQGGLILAREAKARGFNVVLGGGMNLVDAGRVDGAQDAADHVGQALLGQLALRQGVTQGADEPLRRPPVAPSCVDKIRGPASSAGPRLRAGSRNRYSTGIAASTTDDG